MKHNPVLQRCISKLTPESVEHSRLAFDISDRTGTILKQKGISQSELAKGLGKSKEEVSRWLGGTQDFTLNTIATIQSFLGEEIIIVPK